MIHQHKQWRMLILPFVLAACAGNGTNDTPARDPVSTAPKGALNAPESTGLQSPQSEQNQTGTAEKSQPISIQIAINNAANNDGRKVRNNNTVTTTKPSLTVTTLSTSEEKTPPAPNDEASPVETVTEIAKTPITPELTKKVHDAKIARDYGGLDRNYEADYVITTATGQTTAKLKAPMSSSSDAADDSNYFYSDADIFPQGVATGTVKTYLRAGEQRQPHTEETFKSYQQFYSGIVGTQKQVVYFADGANQRDEPFFVEAPHGLLTAVDNIPAAGEATYNGKAISSSGFGDLTYDVDFTNKIGKGGRIVWDKSAGQPTLGDITLAAGKIAPQVLSVYRDPTMFDDTHSSKGTGISGTAIIANDQTGKDWRYTTVFFGAHAEELGGLIFEKNDSNGNALLSEDIENNNIASFAGAR